MRTVRFSKPDHGRFYEILYTAVILCDCFPQKAKRRQLADLQDKIIILGEPDGDRKFQNDEPILKLRNVESELTLTQDEFKMLEEALEKGAWTAKAFRAVRDTEDFLDGAEKV